MSREAGATEPARRAGSTGTRRLGRTLGRYVARQLVGPTLIALLAFAVVVLTVQLATLFDLAVNRGLDPRVVLGIAGYPLVPAIAQALPFAVLLGGLQGRRRFAWFGALVLAEAGCRWPAAVALRHAGVEGAAAAMIGLLVCYLALAAVALIAVRRGVLGGTDAAGPAASGILRARTMSTDRTSSICR